MDILFKDMKLKNKVPMMKYFQKLPGEVLFDISKECKKMNSMNEGSLYKTINKFLGNLYTQAGAYYSPLTDKMTTTNDDSLIHELGHAIDYHYRFITFNISETNLNKNFDKAFEVGLKRYKNDNYKQNYHIKIFSSGEYCTTNKQEMFAECYNLLMTGKSPTADCILYYFPECLEEAKNILKATRKLHSNIRR